MAKVLKSASHCLPMPQTKELETLARHAGYRVKTLALELECSRRYLEIRCHRRFALTPHAMLVRLRTQQIQEQVRTGAPAKVICQQVGFADAASFCHGLKRCLGCTLRELRKLGQNDRSQKDNKDSSPLTITRRESVGVRKDGRCQHETLT